MPAPLSPDPIVQLEQVCVVQQRPDRQQQTILHDVSLSAGPGNITAIVGPSGSGKSTLIRLINRLSDPASGTIRLQGQDIVTLDPLTLRSQVAMVLQKPFMFEGTTLDNLQRPCYYRNFPLPGADSPDLREILELTSLPGELLHRNARTLSLGEQQRVNLARALMTAPRVLLLDEPTSALDRPTGDRLAATFQDICRQRTLSIILVTHDLRLTERIADYLYYLEQGIVYEHGLAADLLKTPQSTQLRRFLAEPDAGVTP